MESDTPIKSASKPPAAANKPNNDDNDAELQAELQQVRALVSGGPSTTDRTPKDKPSSKHQNADLTFGNDESPTPLRIPKRKRKDRGNDDDDDGDDERTDSDDGKKIRHKRSLIGNMKPAPKRQAESFIDDEADDLGDSDGDSEEDHSDDAEFDGDNDDGEGVSLNALKKQILGRKLVTTPATPHSNHKEIYLQSEKVMMADRKSVV